MKTFNYYKKIIREILKGLIFKYTNLWNPSYPYWLEPCQLAFLVNEISSTKNIDGCLLEIGVARGMTTKFLCEHIVKENINVKYYAMDTFRSFDIADMKFEVDERGKILEDIYAFDFNDLDVFRQKFKDYDFIEVIKSDCKEFDYSKIGPIKIVLLDVDLYLPTKVALQKIYPLLVTGGVILCDNVCHKDHVYDGAKQAYDEFCDENNLEKHYFGNMSGVIRANGINNNIHTNINNT